MATLSQSSGVSRRDFLLTGGAVMVGFSLSASLPKFVLAQAASTSDIGKPLDAHQVDSFLAFHADSSVTIYTSKVDIGTGLRIAMSQMAAEELGIPVESVSIVEGDTALVPDHGGTGGSTGVPRGGVDVRQAAATARQAILNLGAAQLKRPANELTIARGIVRPAAGGAGISIGKLIGGRRLNLQVDAKAPLKDPATYTVVGKPLLRPDVPAKCTGKREYVQDHTVPNMLHGRVIRPPAIGAKLVSVDDSSIRDVPGVRIVRVESFLGVVAPDELAAIRAARELKATWTEWQGLPGNDGLDRYVRESAVDHDETVVSKGGAMWLQCFRRRQSNSPLPTPGRARVTRRWAHPAQLPTCARMARRYGPRLRGLMASGRNSRKFLACRKKSCG